MSELAIVSLKAWKKKEIKKQYELYEKLEKQEFNKSEKARLELYIKRVEDSIVKIEKELDKEERRLNRK